MELGLLVLVFLLVFLNSPHILSILIAVELSAIILFVYFFALLPSFFFYGYLLFMAILACDSVLGLILFVIFSRYFSKDYINSLGLLMF